MKKAVLLVNLGTPKNCDASSVYHYLKEFLNDPRVVDLPKWLRWPLVNGIILPFRYKKTAALYQNIWQAQGSPLLINSERLREALAQELGEAYEVVLGMRYGEPTIPFALSQLKQVDSLTVIPLFPQFSSAATGSAIEKVLKAITMRWNIPAIKVVKEFYQHPDYIAAYSEVIQQTLHDKTVDLILFSYHGIPERHINKSHCHATCDRLHQCPTVNDDNLYCYRAQCYHTTQLIAANLNLPPLKYRVSFQSRLGRTPWIKPYTDKLLHELIRKGIKHLAMVSPSFVCDCLETLEEINIRTRKAWELLGGASFTFIPCLNNSPHLVNALAKLSKSA